MNIAIIGYGRMGHLIEQTALKLGHKIACIIDVDNRELFDSDEFRHADVAIEFSVPAAAAENVRIALERGVPVVSGTTGWADRLEEMRSLANRLQVGFLQASNFSVGVNIFRAITRYAAALFARFPGYTAELSEVHHIHKLDHPSGTAISLAEDIIANTPTISGWNEPASPAEATAGILPLYHERKGEVPGIHTVSWHSEADEVSLTHSAHNRNGFALGAVMAAEWLASRHGAFSIDDFFNSLINSSES